MPLFGFRSRMLLALCVACAIFRLAAHLALAADALTQHYNNTRTGAVLDETTLTTTNVNTATFGKRWTLYADGQVVAQPLYVSALADRHHGQPDTPLVQGTFNAVIVATMHNTIYVYDADKENRGPPTVARGRSGRRGSVRRARAAKTSTCGAPTIRSGASSRRPW